MKILFQKRDYGVCSSYYDSFVKLTDKGILSEKNLNTYKKMIGMRNKIVHDYERISKEMLYDVIKNNLGDFNCFIEDINKNIK